MDCVFCNVVQKKVPAKFYYETEHVIVIEDILPKAPVHMLVIPKKHISAISSVTEADEALLGKMILAAKQITETKGIAESGYKLMFNVGKDGGQIVPHLHLHVLGGKQLGEISS